MQQLLPKALRSRKALLLCANSLFLTLLIWQLRAIYSKRVAAVTESPNTPPPSTKSDSGRHYPSTPPPCQSRLDWLNELDIPFPIKYARRDIIVRSNPQAQRSSLTKVDGPLFGDLQIVDPAKGNESVLLNCMEPLRLDVPAFPKTPPDASHIVLGGATSLGRLEASLPFFQRWLAHTGVKSLHDSKWA